MLQNIETGFYLDSEQKFYQNYRIFKWKIKTNKLPNLQQTMMFQ